MVRGWYDEARSIVTECGARQAQQRLDGGSARPGRDRRPRGPPAQLSPAERNVALLVAEG